MSKGGGEREEGRERSEEDGKGVNEEGRGFLSSYSLSESLLSQPSLATAFSKIFWA